MRDLPPKRLGAISTAAGLATRLACERAQAAGIELEPLLRKAGLTKQQVEDVDVRISVPCQIGFLNFAASALQDEFLGFHLGQELAELRKLGLLYYVPASSDTLGDALRRLVRYASMANESADINILGGRDITIVFNYVGVPRHVDRHQIEWWLTLLIRLCRKLTGCPVEPSRVSLVHRRAGNLAEIAAFFRCEIKFGATIDEVVFAAPIGDIPIVSADPYLNKLLIANCEEALSRRPMMEGPFRSVVENAIAPLLPHGNARVSEIASQCGLSERTFERRLRSEDLTFSEVLNDLRRDLATQYLADAGLSISQIAWLLGYQEVSAFTNAFKRWTGKRLGNHALRHEGRCFPRMTQHRVFRSTGLDRFASMPSSALQFVNAHTYPQPPIAEPLSIGPCPVWIKVRNPASVAVQRGRSENWNR